MNSTLAQRALPISNATVRNILLAIAGSLLVAVAAQVKVPFWPVPMTMQTLAVLMVGGAYGARLGAATLALYALEGAIGLPFLSGARNSIFDAHIAFLPYSSFGYLIGFALAAYVVGRLAQSGAMSSALNMVGATLIGAVLVYVPGLIWLAIWASISQHLTAADAMQFAYVKGMDPFIPADILKATIAGLGLAGMWNSFKR